MKLKYGIFFSAIIIFILSSCGDKTNKIQPPKAGSQLSDPPALGVQGYIIHPSVLHSSIEVAGTLLPFEETEIHPEVSGKVTYLSINEGTHVKKGILLARLFDGDLQAQLRKLKVQLQVAQKTEERQSELLKIGGISQVSHRLTHLPAPIKSLIFSSFEEVALRVFLHHRKAYVAIHL